MRIRSLLALVLLAATVVVPPVQGSVPSRTHLALLEAGPVPQATPFPLSHVGVEWRGDEDARLEVRSGTPGRLGPWQRVAVSHDLGDEAAGLHRSGLLRADGATAVQARTRAGGARDVRIVAIDAVSGYLRSPGAPLATPGDGYAAAEGGDARVVQPAVVPRAAWGADEGMRTGAPAFARPAKLFVHHTVTPNDDPDPASTVRAIYAYHTRQNGWNDIGYNFLIDASGRIYEGRYARPYAPGEHPTGEDPEGRGVVGAHAKGFNPGSVGVALLGDFSGGGAPSAPALDSLVALLAWKADRHGIDPHGADPYARADGSSVAFPNLAGHRDVGQTACPGSRLYDRLPEVRDRVAGAVRPGPAPAPLPPPPLPPIPGFWTATAEGRVRAYGDAPHAGDLAGRRLAAPVVSMAATGSGNGYWLGGADGGVFAFGDAPFLGAATGRLAGPALQLEPTPTGRGYWVVSEGGEVAAFGDATYLGSTAPPPVEGHPMAGALEMAGLAATPTGQGYWLAAADGRVFAFGDALARGAAGGRAVTLPEGDPPPAPGAGAAPPIVSIAAHPDGRGYWLLGADGGVFAFGVGFFGSAAGRKPAGDAVQLRVSEGGEGYYVAGADGAVLAFGDADRRRELPGGQPEVVDFALRGAPRLSRTP